MINSLRKDRELAGIENMHHNVEDRWKVFEEKTGDLEMEARLQGFPTKKSEN